MDSWECCGVCEGVMRRAEDEEAEVDVRRQAANDLSGLPSGNKAKGRGRRGDGSNRPSVPVASPPCPLPFSVTIRATR